MSRRVLAAFLPLVLGCNAALVRLETRGRHDDVIAKAADRNRPPRRAGARALASALVAVGDVERARDVLLGDFRRGGQLASLVQLADLELELGRDGVAAVHYVRVASIDRTVLRGRRDVCALLDTRAAAWIGLGEGGAALDDLDTRAKLCGEADARQRKRAENQLRGYLAKRHEPAPCGPECQRSADDESSGAIHGAIDRARVAGPEALRELAAREQLTLDAADVIALLMADLRGAAGSRLVDDDELAGWIGGADVETFLPGLRAASQIEGAYLRLRLERVLGRTPDGGAASPSQRMVWLDRASVVEGAVRWRLLAYAGDLVAAEQDIVARWRPTATSERPSSGPREDVVRPTAVHWSLRVRPTVANHRELLTFARLRDASDDRDLALELQRNVLRELATAKAPEARDALRVEVIHALGWGRPWLALALADVGGTADIEPLRQAAATGILLGEVSCEGPCEEERPDLDAIGRTLGEPWIAAQRAKLRELALGHAQQRPRAGACPGLDEVLAPGADSPLSRALARARESSDIGVPRALVAAIESDATLVCGARLALPLLVERDAKVSASRLADGLVHGTLSAAESRTMHAVLALLARQPALAEQLGIAAAAVGDPRESWRTIARYARRTGSRNVEVYALRELLLHSARFEDDAVRRELVAHSIVDGARAWGPRDTPAGRESVTYIVEEHLARLPAAQRWAERDAVFTAVARHGLDAAVLGVVQRTLLSEARIAELGSTAAATDPALAWRPSRLARAARDRKLATTPPTVTVFADPERHAAFRLALADGARDWAQRRRAAIGVAVLGTEAERAKAAAELLEMSTPGTRPLLERLLLERPAAIDTRGGAATSVVPADDVLLHVLLGRSGDDALWLAPTPVEAP